MTQLPGILSKSPLMGSLCPSSLCHPLMDVSEVLKHTWSHSMVTSRKPKSCHCQSRHCICVVWREDEQLEFCKGHFIKISSEHGSRISFFFFSPSFPPSWCRQLSLPTPIFGSSAQIPPVSEPAPPGMSSPQHLVLEQEQLMKEQELIISNKKSLATRHRLISAN